MSLTHGQGDHEAGGGGEGGDRPDGGGEAEEVGDDAGEVGADGEAAVPPQPVDPDRRRPPRGVGEWYR